MRLCPSLVDGSALEATNPNGEAQRLGPTATEDRGQGGAYVGPDESSGSGWRYGAGHGHARRLCCCSRHPLRHEAAAAPLVPGADFTISTTITSSPTSADHAALLYPGVTRYLWYTVHNPLPQAITVTSLGIASVQAPPACPRANLDLDQLGLTGAFIVPSGATATVLAPRPISLRNLPVNQDACKDVTFTFTFTGTGWYSDGSNPQDPQNPQNPTDPQNPPAPTHRPRSAPRLSSAPDPTRLPWASPSRFLPASPARRVP